MQNSWRKGHHDPSTSCTPASGEGVKCIGAVPRLPSHKIHASKSPDIFGAYREATNASLGLDERKVVPTACRLPPRMRRPHAFGQAILGKALSHFDRGKNFVGSAALGVHGLAACKGRATSKQRHGCRAASSLAHTDRASSVAKTRSNRLSRGHSRFCRTVCEAGAPRQATSC